MDAELWIWSLLFVVFRSETITSLWGGKKVCSLYGLDMFLDWITVASDEC